MQLCSSDMCLGFQRVHSVAWSCPTLHDPMDCSPLGSSVGFFGQEYWSGLPFPIPGDLSNPGIEPAFPATPVLAGLISLQSKGLSRGFFNITVQKHHGGARRSPPSVPLPHSLTASPGWLPAHSRGRGKDVLAAASFTL